MPEGLTPIERIQAAKNVGERKEKMAELGKELSNVAAAELLTRYLEWAGSNNIKTPNTEAASACLEFINQADEEYALRIIDSKGQPLENLDTNSYVAVQRYSPDTRHWVSIPATVVSIDDVRLELGHRFHEVFEDGIKNDDQEGGRETPSEDPEKMV